MSNRIQTLALVLLGVPVLLLALPATANADTIYVCWDGSGDYLTIQEGIDAAVDGDEVVVCEGTYHENIDFKGKAVTVMSSGGPSVTVIDADGLFHVVSFANGEGPGSVLEGFTIRDGAGWFDPFGRCAGGGIYCAQTSPTIKNNVISGNQTMCHPAIKGVGGGICCLWGARPRIINCVIDANEADYGAGIYCEFSTPSLINCTFSANWAAEDGGGMCVIDPFLGRFPEPIALSNCTFSANGSSLGMGGAIYTFQAVLSLTNCILWEDSASQGPEIALEGTPWCWPSWVSLDYCDVQDGQAGIYVDPYSTLFWGEGNLEADPLFADPDSHDYHLSVGSPCIDAGDPNFVPGPDERDIDGQMRVWDGDDDGQWIVDMGSDEFGSIIPGDLNGDGCVDQADLGILLSAWETSDTGDLNGDGETNQADLGILLAHWGEGCP